jgi:hypothetical protein
MTMKNRILVPLLIVAAAVAGFSLARIRTMDSQAQTQTQAYQGPRTADGKPDLNGVWQAFSTASYDVLDHSAQKGIPAGQGVVEGNEIPYRPEAAAQKEQNYKNRMSLDPLHKCYLPGVPRITYMPFPFEITQTPKMVGIAYEYVHAVRQIHTDGSTHPEGALDFWMGDSRGRWEGDTLIVDITNFNGETWFDQAGNFHSEALHVVERYIPNGPNHLTYEVTLEDPKVFTRPWKMTMPLYRRLEKDVRVMDYECLEFEEPFSRWDEAPVPGMPGPPKK